MQHGDIQHYCGSTARARSHVNCSSVISADSFCYRQKAQNTVDLTNKTPHDTHNHLRLQPVTCPRCVIYSMDFLSRKKLTQIRIPHAMHMPPLSYRYNHTCWLLDIEFTVKICAITLLCTKQNAKNFRQKAPVGLGKSDQLVRVVLCVGFVIFI